MTDGGGLSFGEATAGYEEDPQAASAVTTSVSDIAIGGSWWISAISSPCLRAQPGPSRAKTELICRLWNLLPCLQNDLTDVMLVEIFSN